MNMEVGSIGIAGVFGEWSVDEWNENVQYLVDVCAERGLY